LNVYYNEISGHHIKSNPSDSGHVIMSQFSVSPDSMNLHDLMGYGLSSRNETEGVMFWG